MTLFDDNWCYLLEKRKTIFPLLPDLGVGGFLTFPLSHPAIPLSSYSYRFSVSKGITQLTELVSRLGKGIIEGKRE